MNPVLVGLCALTLHQMLATAQAASLAQVIYMMAAQLVYPEQLHHAHVQNFVRLAHQHSLVIVAVQVL